jgi:hypothetical protein
MTLNKLLFLGFLLLSTSTMQAQTQLKQFGTKIFDETGRTVKLSKAIEISKPKSEKAYIAFKLAEYLRDDRQRYFFGGYFFGAFALVPQVSYVERNLIYTWRNAYFTGLSIGSFYLAPKKKEIEDVLAIGIKAFNESSTTNE